MRIGFDVDGILANFIAHYQMLTVKMAGFDLFQPGDIENPPTWDWPEMRGYDPVFMKRVWAAIIESPNFWRNLPPLEDARTLALVAPDLQTRHDLYFITSRPSSKGAKRQTEAWLQEHIGIALPTVLISGEKGIACRALKLDAYIDDYHENIVNVLEQSPGTDAFLKSTNYNAAYRAPEMVRRVNTLGQMFDYLILNL